MDSESNMIENFWKTHNDAKNCPFCGSNNLYIHCNSNKRWPHNNYYFIKCGICKASSGAYENIEAVYTHWQQRLEANRGE